LDVVTGCSCGIKRYQKACATFRRLGRGGTPSAGIVTNLSLNQKTFRLAQNFMKNFQLEQTGQSKKKSVRFPMFRLVNGDTNIQTAILSSSPLTPKARNHIKVKET
jgi:hypothetical protein